MSDVAVTFGAKDENLARTFKSVGEQTNGLKRSFSGLLVPLGAAVASFISIRGAVSAFNSALSGIKELADFGGRISDLAAQTGLSTENTLVLGQAFKNAGLSSEAMGMAVNRLQKALAGVDEDGSNVGVAFQRLNLSVEKLRQMDAAQAMDEVGKAIAALPNDTDKARAAMELFGRSGGKMLALFKDSTALETAAKQLGGLSGNLAESVNQLDMLSDAIIAAQELKGLQFMAGFAAGFAGDMQKAADTINSIDLSKLGEQMGTLAGGAKAFADRVGEAKDSVDAKVPALEQAHKVLRVMLARMTGINVLQSGYNELLAAGNASKDRSVELSAVGAANANAEAQAQEELNRQSYAGLNLLSDSNAVSLDTLRLFEETGNALGHQVSEIETMLNVNSALSDVEKLNKKIAEEIVTEKQAQLELELAIAEAAAAGNEEEVQRLERIRKYNEALKTARDAEMKNPEAFANRMAAASVSAGPKKERQLTPREQALLAPFEEQASRQNAGRNFAAAGRTEERGKRRLEQQRQRDAAKEIQKELGLGSGMLLSPEEMARREGVSIQDRAKRADEIRQEIKNRAGQGDGTEAEGGSRSGRGKGGPTQSPLEKLVSEIKTIVAAIEPKLPVSALTA